MTGAVLALEKVLAYTKLQSPDGVVRLSSAEFARIIYGVNNLRRLAAAAPGVDSQWKLRLYGLVRTGEREQAIQFLRETRGLSRRDAAKRVKAVAAALGIG
jgi:hypothetical protein